MRITGYVQGASRSDLDRNNLLLSACCHQIVVAPRATIKVVRSVEAHYENGVLRPLELLGLLPGERVRLIVIRRPDPSRWDLAKLRKTGNGDDLPLAEQGLDEWESSLEATERS